MGQNKALLCVDGEPQILRMQKLLESTGLKHILVCGEVPGFSSVHDSIPFMGPALAMYRMMQTFPAAGYLFIPVDMPLLTPFTLTDLLEHKEGAYYALSPLPAYLTKVPNNFKGTSVRSLLIAAQAMPISVSHQNRHCLQNANTPEEWREMIRLCK
jgi:molybdopterin-guanine dinucleotide biosynthesis protein A